MGSSLTWAPASDSLPGKVWKVWKGAVLLGILLPRGHWAPWLFSANSPYLGEGFLNRSWDPEGSWPERCNAATTHPTTQLQRPRRKLAAGVPRR